jgi:hypothetical protein
MTGEMTVDSRVDFADAHPLLPLRVERAYASRFKRYGIDFGFRDRAVEPLPSSPGGLLQGQRRLLRLLLQPAAASVYRRVHVSRRTASASGMRHAPLPIPRRAR